MGKYLDKEHAFNKKKISEVTQMNTAKDIEDLHALFEYARNKNKSNR